METYWLVGKEGFHFKANLDTCVYIPKKKSARATIAEAFRKMSFSRKSDNSENEKLDPSDTNIPTTTANLTTILEKKASLDERTVAKDVIMETGQQQPSRKIEHSVNEHQQERSLTNIKDDSKNDSIDKVDTEMKSATNLKATEDPRPASVLKGKVKNKNKLLKSNPPDDTHREAASTSSLTISDKEIASKKKKAIKKIKRLNKVGVSDDFVSRGCTPSHSDGTEMQNSPSVVASTVSVADLLNADLYTTGNVQDANEQTCRTSTGRLSKQAGNRFGESRSHSSNDNALDDFDNRNAHREDTDTVAVKGSNVENKTQQQTVPTYELLTDIQSQQRKTSSEINEKKNVSAPRVKTLQQDLDADKSFFRAGQNETWAQITGANISFATENNIEDSSDRIARVAHQNDEQTLCISSATSFSSIRSCYEFGKVDIRCECVSLKASDSRADLLNANVFALACPTHSSLNCQNAHIEKHFEKYDRCDNDRQCFLDENLVVHTQISCSKPVHDIADQFASVPLDGSSGGAETYNELMNLNSKSSNFAKNRPGLITKKCEATKNVKVEQQHLKRPENGTLSSNNCLLIDASTLDDTHANSNGSWLFDDMHLVQKGGGPPAV